MPKVAQPVERHAVSVMCPAHAKWSLSALFLSDAMWCPKLEATFESRPGRLRSGPRVLQTVGGGGGTIHIPSSAGSGPGRETGSQLTALQLQEGLRGIQIGKMCSFRAGWQLQASYSDLKNCNYNY